MQLKYKLFILAVLLLSSCKNLVPSSTSSINYVGTYNQVNQPASRITITKEGIVYKIDFVNEGNVWVGSGYETQGKIIAVLKREDEEMGEFATLSLAGEDQLFIVSRDLEGSYKWDGYFTEVVE